MNFVWFIVATVVWSWFFWYFLLMIISVPSIPFMALVAHVSENPHKKWSKILFPIAIFFGFIFGTLLISLVFGGGIGLIALNFAEKATHPLAYFILAGIGAFYISSPAGETSIIASILSLLSYLLVVNINNIANLMGTTVALLYNLLWFVFVMAFIGFAIWGVFAWLKSASKDNVIKNAKRNITKFKKLLILNGISYVVFIGLAILVRIFWGGLGLGPTMSRIVLFLSALYFIAIWLILLFYLYAVSKVLKISGNLNVRPSLILILTIVGSYTMFIVPIAIFIILWIKSNYYIKYELGKAVDTVKVEG